MKYLIIAITLILNLAILSSQQYTNVIRPFSEKYNVNIESNKGSSLSDLGFEKSDLKLKELTSDSYARNLNVDFDIKENGIKYKLKNGKYLYVARINLNDAKTLNFSFDGLYLNKGSKLVIYSSDKKQIIGPITPYDNSLFFTTHIILSNDVYFELITSDETDENVSLSKIAYGIRNYDHFIDTEDKFKKLTYNKNSKNPSVQNNCSTYTQSDFDDDIEDSRNSCNHYGTYNYGATGMEEANCNGYEKIEKSKRAEVIVASYRCETESWDWKSGILINTADTSASNYCDSYVLTCRHCLIGGWDTLGVGNLPTYISIRFNWIRNQCDLSQMPSCSSDPQAWKDLINFNEVIDYNDVSFHSGYRSSIPLTEYAFLKVNSLLKFKEYYNGWRIVAEQFNRFKIDSYALGAVSQLPFNARDQIAEFSGNGGYSGFIQINPSTGDSLLFSGHSGTSILDTNGYLIGITISSSHGINMGLLYTHSPWVDTNLTIKPREVIDENEIYLTDFNNKDEILIEGVERYEKGDCLFSTTTCNPSLDLSEYLTPITGDGCCFRLEYIDSLDGFMGGLPYGIRIYRDNETQQTLYYDFGAHVFAGTELDYYNELEDNVITFCLDSNELSQDGGSIVIEFQDNNGKIICVKTVEVECLECCSEENMQIYLDFDGPPGNEGCCANIEIDVDSTATYECDFEYALVYDASDSTLIVGGDLVTWKDTLLTIPFTFCNYDSVNKYFRIDFYNSDSLLLCSRTTTIPLPPCDLSGLKSSGSNNMDKFDITRKELKQDEITFEYQIPKDEEIEIELVNKYNVSLGVIHEKSAKKGKSDFKLNLDKYKPGIYVLKMKSKSQTILRKWIIE